jgi:hypothetical protein
MTKTAAIKKARASVSNLYKFGSGYKFNCYDDGKKWRESCVCEYHLANCHRSQCLIDHARELVGKPHTQYDGGKWVDYV